ncbi:hypothetical protein LCGC14_0811350 [marine sediment metagenome]|uniref:Uncharacterized protein n=1 Tax=marine sediment metagenome TaxID=412755 RepID=A0A0F9PR29_9ZZZZ
MGRAGALCPAAVVGRRCPCRACERRAEGHDVLRSRPVAQAEGLCTLYVRASGITWP